MLLSNAPFTLPIDIRFADTDTNGHVFFANYLAYFDTALLKYLNHIGCRNGGGSPPIIAFPHRYLPNGINCFLFLLSCTMQCLFGEKR